MNPDASPTQSPPTEPAWRRELIAETQPVVAVARQLAVTEPAPVMTEPAPVMTEPAPVMTEPAPNMTAPLPAMTEPVSLEPVSPPHDSEPLRQLDRLTALVEEQLRKSNPARTAPKKTTSPPPTASSVRAEEESLQLYLDRFMERVTGKKPDATPEPAAEPVAAAAPSLAPIAPAEPPQPAESPQPREPVRPPECREKMAAMRDVANQNARTAMAVHTGGQWRKAQTAGLLAVSASFVSSICAATSLIRPVPGAIEVAAAAGLVALFLACRFFLQCRQMAAVFRAC